MLLIPIKNLVNAKQRLSLVLNQPERTALAHTMLWDVLTAVSTSSIRTCLVTSDPYALQLAENFHCEVIADNFNPGETGAIEMATHICESREIETTIVVPADIPLIQTEEINQILTAAPEQGSVIVAASDGRGTNAILRRPAGLFPLRFGNDSFKPHHAAACATGKPCVVLSFPGIGLDVDNPSDLYKLASAAGETRSQQLVRKWGFASYPNAVNL
ncbi:MAG TPA: 2-phospho-L-lactate guanylyltransferase [Terriglobales bacterium]|jgi:2-phospho-L-lactate guanylyltransferase